VSGHPTAELPGLVRGELAADAAAELYGHLDGCDRCRRDLDAVRRASDALAAAAELPADAADLPALELPAQDGQAASRRRRRVVLAVAGLVVAVSLVAGLAGLRRTAGGSGPEAGPATVLTAVDGGAAQGQAKVTGDERRKVVTLETLNLPAPGDGWRYEVWLAPRGQAPAVALGQLATDNQGLWSVPSAVAERYDGHSIQVWLEPVDGGPEPTGRPVLRGPFRDTA
jgi:hypothetical protein